MGVFAKFTGGEDGAWPLSKIIAALEDQYGVLDELGEDGPLKVFGIQENGINFVVALMQSGAGSGQVVEFGFLARFAGFSVSDQLIEALNRNLHISMVAIEAGDLFLMAGLQVTGRFDQGQFSLLLETWRRDLMMTLHGLSDAHSSLVAAFPAARLDAARSFAVNVAPAPADDRPIDMLSSFLGGKNKKAICEECHGRGKRGFIARMCGTCEGSGFTKPRQQP